MLIGRTRLISQSANVTRSIWNTESKSGQDGGSAPVLGRCCPDIDQHGAEVKIIRAFRILAIALLLILPSLSILVWPFPCLPALNAIAMGTLVPILVFGVIGALRWTWKKDAAIAAIECAAIVFCFSCLQAYIFNTALHPANRFNLIGGLLPNADPSLYLSLANQW